VRGEEGMGGIQMGWGSIASCSQGDRRHCTSERKGIFFHAITDSKLDINNVSK